MNKRSEIRQIGKIELNYYTLRALFCLLVILDHNNYWVSLFPDFYKSFGFPVVGFLVLPFFFPSHSISKQFLLDRAVRLGVPYVTFGALGYFSLLVAQLPEFPTWQSLLSLLRELMQGTFASIELSTGLAAL